jgi:Domain of unknown function (DUF4282)
MEIRDLLFFDKMIVPKVILVIYWILLVVVVLGAIGVMFSTSFLAGLGALIFGPLFVRIWCELLIVMFKINEALQTIRDK